MNKNWIEQYGEKVRKRKEENLKVVEKYWKLPAAERMHYDSCANTIESQTYSFFGISYSFMRLMVVLPIFFLFIGLMTGVMDKMVIISSTLIVSFIKVLPAIFLIDFLLAVASRAGAYDRDKKLDKRFKLIK